MKNDFRAIFKHQSVEAFGNYETHILAGKTRKHVFLLCDVYCVRVVLWLVVVENDENRRS